MDKLIGGTGLMMFFIGASAMDSDPVLVPAVMTIVGLALMAVSAREVEKDKKIDP
ncbi:MAG: hypothetical protein IJ335_06450 [Lachnospiraceae bacterium]|nr:hypothetical protein [Lachnospiraceae bacterium]